MNNYPRHCPVCHRRCPSPVAFRRHLLWHDLELVGSGRGCRRTERFRRLPPEEAKFRRLLQSCRQGGRSDVRRRLMASRCSNRPVPSTSAATPASPVDLKPATAPTCWPDVTSYHPAGNCSPTSSTGSTNNTGFASASLASSFQQLLELATVSSVSADGGYCPLPPLSVVDAGVQTDDVPVCDSAVDARPLPTPLLEFPRMAPSQLAERSAQFMFVDPVASPRVLAEHVLDQLPTPPSPGERRAVEFAVRFASDVLRSTADQLLNTLSAHLGQLRTVDMSAILRVIAEHLDAWRKRPSAPEDDPLSDFCNL